MASTPNPLHDLANREYKWGFITDIESDRTPKGLNEDVIRLISAKKNEPPFMLDWRLKAYRAWSKMAREEGEPRWANVTFPPIDYQDLHYYAAPKMKKGPEGLDEVDPELRATFEKLGISLDEQKRLTGVAVDAVFDSVSVATTFKKKLAEVGVIFCSFSDAVANHPDLVEKYLARWSPTPTTSTPRSTPRSSATAPSSTCRRACAARWSCRPTSASTPPRPGSSRGR